MIRKNTAAALFLAAVPAFLTMTLCIGTAQADGVRSGDDLGHHGRHSRITADGDTPWGSLMSHDTPWGLVNSAPASPIDGLTAGNGDTPWGR
ncbi:hypothetical protein [Lentzea jiangxiensis]|uniref:Uncharacterized protein n=1 Tax=Lentzea jiangxiensis TaxID=641025 RepID=A0A1H0KZS5_9PSEU|nr:hypothetical protein [Lentzea jiangxiensis]SDO61272.1 hypothetical protein SAMN05421507_103124 [Lentzea jiangxiensis]